MLNEDSQTDDELMLSLGQGNDHALNLLMERWGPKIISFLWRMTQDPETAKDLAQDCFVRLYRAKDRYQSGGTFAAYLYRIAGNLGRNYLRRHRKHGIQPIDTLNEQGIELESKDQTPDEQTKNREEMVLVRQWISLLPEDLRLPLVFSIWEGLSHREIAIALECSVKAVEMRIYRARQLIRKEYERSQKIA